MMKINVNILLIDELNNLSDYENLGFSKDKLITIYTETLDNLLQASFGNDFTKCITIKVGDDND